MLKHNQCIFLFQSDELKQEKTLIGVFLLINICITRDITDVCLIAKYNALASINDDIPKHMKTAFFI